MHEPTEQIINKGAVKVEDIGTWGDDATNPIGLPVLPTPDNANLKTDLTAMQKAAELPVPSIESSAMTVSFSASVPTFKKHDRKAGDEIAQSKNAEVGTFKADKFLLGKNCPQHKAIQDHTARSRAEHARMTMPWGDLGERLLPVALHKTYKAQMNNLETEFFRLVQVFLDAYDWEVIQAETRLGDSFLAHEYPTRDEVANKFRWRVVPRPIATNNDWRIQTNKDALDETKRDFQAAYEEDIKTALYSIFDRLRVSLVKFSKELDWKENEKPKRVYQGVLDGILELLDVMRHCNIFEDMQMKAVCEKLDAHFRGIGKMPIAVESLREDEHLREETRSIMKEALAALPSLDM